MPRQRGRRVTIYNNCGELYERSDGEVTTDQLSVLKREAGEYAQDMIAFYRDDR